MNFCVQTIIFRGDLIVEIGVTEYTMWLTDVWQHTFIWQQPLRYVFTHLSHSLRDFARKPFTERQLISLNFILMNINIVVGL